MKIRKIAVSIFCVLLAAAVVFSVSACERGQNASPSVEGDPSFSGDNSDYTDNIGYEDGGAEDADLAAAYEATYRSVVTVSVAQAGIVQTGTGFIVDSAEGLVVTSSSLFSNASGGAAAEDCTVGLYDGTDLSAELQGYDALEFGFGSFLDVSSPVGSMLGAASANSDIALVRLNDVENGEYTVAGQPESLPAAVTFSDSDALVYGEECYTVATLAHEDDVMGGLMNEGIVTKPFNRHGSSFYTLDNRLSSAVEFFDGSFEYLVQTGVPVNQGNAGAPLFNADGEVIGMINMRVNDTYVYSANAPFGIAFATPSETLNEVLTEAGVSVGYEQQNADRESCIVNADSLSRSAANDSVARMLMLESPDYLVVNEGAEVIFRSQGEESESGTAACRVAENRLDRTVKIIAYAESGASQILSEGSGFLIDKSGYVMTNLHVINALSEQNQEDSGLANTSVQLSDNVYCLFERGTDSGGRFIVMPMDIVAYHQQGDLAILKFRNPIYYEGNASRSAGFESACVLERNVPRTGESVVALGNALGYGVSVSAGIVSIPEFKSYYSIYGYNMIQTDCPINSGNSGGALFDAEGNVIGINTLGFGGEGYDNVSWAIPASFAVEFVGSVNSGVSSGQVHITAEGKGADIKLES